MRSIRNAIALHVLGDKVDQPDHGTEASKVEMTGETAGAEIMGTIAEEDCPDGGYGWIVVICLVLMYAVSWGMSTTLPPFLSLFLTFSSSSQGYLP